MTNYKICTNCGRKISDSAITCRFCGSRSFRPFISNDFYDNSDYQYCPHCGERIKANTFLCGFCGNRVDNSSVSPPPQNQYETLKNLFNSHMNSFKEDNTFYYDSTPLMDNFKQSFNVTFDAIFLNDILNWLSFLGLADGVIADDEIFFINYILDLNLTRYDILNHLNQFVGDDYVTSLPLSFMIYHEQDIILEDVFKEKGLEPYTEGLYALYDLIGNAFIACDGNVDYEELQTKSFYMETLRNNLTYFKNVGYYELLSSFAMENSSNNLSLETNKKLNRALELFSQGHSLNDVHRMGIYRKDIKQWFEQGQRGNPDYVPFYNALISIRPNIASELGIDNKTYFDSNDSQSFNPNSSAASSIDEVNFSQSQNAMKQEFDDETTLESILEDLNNLVGLEAVKKDVNSLINLIQVRKIRAERGLKQPDMSLHLVFSGNPGTGKTTVARMLSEIYCKLGLLSKGHLIETDRSGLVAGYVGQTAIKTQEVIQEAMGGILFIDEAYTLSSSKGETDFGQESIDTILKAMEDNRDDFIVIVAGYPNLMAEFLQSNPGLESRFNKYIHFEDYNPQELYDIFIGMCKDSSLVLDEKADEFVRTHFKQMYDNRSENFANGRYVRNLFEKVLSNQANRIMGIPNITDSDLNTLKYEDFFD